MKLYIVETYQECELIYADDPEQAKALAVDAFAVYELPQPGELARMVGRFTASCDFDGDNATVEYREVK